MQALIFTPDTLPVEPNTSKITGIDPAGKFQSEGFTIQLHDINTLKTKYKGWIEITLTLEEKEKISNMDLPHLAGYLQDLVSRSGKKVGQILSGKRLTHEIEFA